MIDKTTTIAAVVVTFNRKVLLIECLNALLAQTRPMDKIYLIDNASSDGTQALLEEHNLLNHPLIDYRLMTENLGGAGGFNEGVKCAFEDGFDWVWLLDDDGLADCTCLEKLLTQINDYDVLGPLIISTDDINKTSFGYYIEKKLSFSVEEAKQSKITTPVHPFNGTLISSKVIEKIGLPDKRFFIWGDEIDYRNKWLKANYNEGTVTNAIYFHPPYKVNEKNIIKYAMPLTDIKNKNRKYLYYRNKMYNIKNGLGNYFMKSAVIFLLTIFVVLLDKDRWFCIHALYHGYMSNLNKTPSPE